MFATLVDVGRSCLDHPFESVAQIYFHGESQHPGPLTQQAAGSTTPRPDLDYFATDVPRLAEQMPQLPAPVQVDKRIVPDLAVTILEIPIQQPGAVGRPGHEHRVPRRIQVLLRQVLAQAEQRLLDILLSGLRKGLL
ncbi:MAG: hypothetical protein IPG61_15035 [bacterium]|nr:hypothetical protein [bacterium]